MKSPIQSPLLTLSKEKDHPKQEEVIDPLQYHVLKGHTKEINFALFSPDNKFVVSTGDDRALRFVWTDTLSEKTPKYDSYYGKN
jgi:hypothetical protein